MYTYVTVCDFRISAHVAMKPPQKLHRPFEPPETRFCTTFDSRRIVPFTYLSVPGTCRLPEPASQILRHLPHDINLELGGYPNRV